MIFTRLWTLAAILALLGCASPEHLSEARQTALRHQLTQLMSADVILLGEQHDAPDHQRIHRFVVETLASQQRLAALIIEMASAGLSTGRLGPGASEDQVRAALHWNNDLWPWAAYGPAVMASVRADVTVMGANLPTTRLREVMADAGLDRMLAGPALKAQQQNIRLGHCGMLPESQISPMTRIQIARDISMANTIAAAVRPGKIVVLLAGSAHVDRSLGMPLHLPQGLTVKAVLLHAEQTVEANAGAAAFDERWSARAAPAMDYCAQLEASQFKKP